MICKNCGKEIDDKAVLCIHCGRSVKEKSKIPTGLMVFLWIAFLPIMAIVAIARNKKLSKKAKTILIVVIAVFTLIVGIVGSISSAQAEKADYEAIVASIEDKNYEDAQEMIEDFLRNYPDSEYLSEINTHKETVDAEILKIEEDRKAKEEQEKLEKEKEELNAKKNESASNAGISLNAFENMLAACDAIGIEYEKISNLEGMDNWANGKRCSFDFSGYNFMVYFNEDETVNSINSGTIKFYENGQKVEDLKNRLITTAEQSQLKTWAEDHIKKILKSPSSAEFPGSFFTPFEDWSFSKNGSNYTVSSYVDSQNGFGAMIRSQFTIVYEWKDGTGKVTSLIFDGEKII